MKIPLSGGRSVIISHRDIWYLAFRAGWGILWRVLVFSALAIAFSCVFAGSHGTH